MLCLRRCTPSVSGHGHAAIPNIAVQQPFPLRAFPHHDVLPIIEHRAPFTRQSVLARLIGGISLFIHVKDGQRRSFDPGGDDSLPKLLDRFRPTHNIAMRWKELRVWGILRSHPGTIPSAQGSTPLPIPLLNGRTDTPLLSACSTAAAQQREDGQKNQYPVWCQRHRYVLLAKLLPGSHRWAI